MDSNGLIIVFLVIGARLLVPLLIPRFPLPAILTCLIIDAADQTIFQKFTTLPLEGYQGYDKALDIYYLSIAYLSTFRNWTNKTAFQISQFLFYYRMIGDTLFELTHIRALLFIFPNTFEYFFIFYSIVALKWNPKKMSTKFLLGVAAFIWIFIKLPQEYWIHIAQLDTTDFIKQTLFGLPVTTTWAELLRLNMWLIPAAIIFFGLIGFISWKIYKKLPKPDWKLSFKPNTINAEEFKYPTPKSFVNLLNIHKKEFLEKIVFVGLISVIFAQVFPNLRGTNIEVIIGITIIILVNALFGYLIKYASKIKNPLVNSFFLMLVINSITAYVYSAVLTGSEGINSYLVVFFFAYIVTLITVLYDRFKPYQVRS